MQPDGLHRRQPVNSYLGLFHTYAVAPAFSPDGRYVAFFGQPGINRLGDIYVKNAGIWVFDLQQGTAWQVVAVERVQNINWSPANDKLAFEVNETGNITVWVVDPYRQGYPPHSPEISRFPGQQPTWQADGRRLLIKDCRSQCGLWWVNSDGGGQQPLITDSNAATYGLSTDHIHYPALAPNGQLLAFTHQQEDGSFDIYQLNLSTAELRNMTNRPASDIIPSYSRDSSTLYFFTDQYGGDPHWRITAISTVSGTNANGDNELTVLEGIGPPGEWGLYRPAIW
jgi:Tol biopolymer transport system component